MKYKEKECIYIETIQYNTSYLYMLEERIFLAVVEVVITGDLDCYLDCCCG